MIEACLLQSLGLNDCVCSWSVIEYILYFIRTLPHTHCTTQPADKTPATSISLFLHVFLLIAFLLSFFLHFLRFIFALCLTALIPHLCQFISFHLMEAKGRQNDAVIKHSLCNSHGTVGCLLCLQSPTGLISLSTSWLLTLETLAGRHICVGLQSQANQHPALTTSSMSLWSMI